MILATVYHSDLPLEYKTFAAALRSRGPNRPHTLLTLCRPADESAAVTFTHGLSDTFGRHYVGVTLSEGISGLHLSNLLFQTAVRFHAAYKHAKHEPSDVPMLYLDPMWWPINDRWLASLQTDYYQSGAPKVYGNPHNPENPDYRAGVVLGKSYGKESALIDQIPETSHWRKFLAWEMFKDAVNTAQLGDREDSYIRQRPPVVPKSRYR